ncbi:hypothetical protein BGW38_010398, partial [Lunasporangiospora selenospora]
MGALSRLRGHHLNLDQHTKHPPESHHDLDSLTEVDSTETLHESTIPDSEKSPATLIEELVLLRQNNSQLQNHVTTLQRDLAAETRARTRNAVAMQDTRDKFELLSAMAYKKLKEMIFQRHVLEME